MASASIVTDHEGFHGGQGRPHTDLSALVVTIDSKENAKHAW